jgi:hypothetical protein
MSNEMKEIIINLPMKKPKDSEEYNEDNNRFNILQDISINRKETPEGLENIIDNIEDNDSKINDEHSQISDEDGKRSISQSEILIDGIKGDEKSESIEITEKVTREQPRFAIGHRLSK